jgi:hypothetical protein
VLMPSARTFDAFVQKIVVAAPPSWFRSFSRGLWEQYVCVGVAIVCGRGNSDILSSRPIHRFCRRASPIFQFRNTVRIKRNLVSCRTWGGGVAGVVGIEGGVVSGVINLESSGVGASDWRPRHEELYQEV